MGNRKLKRENRRSCVLENKVKEMYVKIGPKFEELKNFFKSKNYKVTDLSDIKDITLKMMYIYDNDIIEEKECVVVLVKNHLKDHFLVEYIIKMNDVCNIECKRPPDLKISPFTVLLKNNSRSKLISNLNLLESFATLEKFLDFDNECPVCMEEYKLSRGILKSYICKCSYSFCFDCKDLLKECPVCHCKIE